MSTHSLRSECLFASIAALAGASHAATYQQDAVFVTEDQGQFGPGAALVNIQESLFLGVDWEQQNFDVGLDAGLAAGFAAVQLDAGRVGFEGNVDISSGAVDVSYPRELLYDHPDQAKAGATFEVRTASRFAPLNDPNFLLDIQGLSFEAGIDFVFDAGASFGGGADFAGFDPVYTSAVPGQPSSITGVPPNVEAYADDIPIFDVNVRESLVQISAQQGVSFDLPVGGVGISAQAPPALDLQSTEPDLDGNLRVEGVGDPFLTLDVDAVELGALAARALGAPIPPLSGELEFDDLFGEDSSTTVSYDLLDLDFAAGPAVAQAFEFIVNGLSVTLTADTGETHTGRIGDTFEFTAPVGQPNLLITTEVTIDQSLKSNTGLALDFAAALAVLSGELEIAGFDVAAFGPLFNQDFNATTAPLYFFTPEFALEGFQPHFGAFEVPIGDALIDTPPFIPEPTSMALLAAGGLPVFAPRGRRRRA